MSQALTDSYTHYNALMRSEKRSEMIDEYNSNLILRIKKEEENIEKVELEIKEAEKIENFYHVKQLENLINQKMNKIESIKRNLING
jgi:hypothetical protein